MPLTSSGIIVVEKPSSPSITRINNPLSTVNTIHSSTHPPQDRNEKQTQIQYCEYYDVHENQQQQKHHSTIVVDATLFHQQQQKHQHQLGGSSGVAIARKIHSSPSVSSAYATTSSSSPRKTSTLFNKTNLQIQTLKSVPMPQNKQYSQQQQIIQHTSHSTSTAGTSSSHKHHLSQQPQHVQQISLAASSIHHQTQHHSQQPTSTPHMIQVSEDFLEQAANNTRNMMISTTGEVINQQQIYKIVSTDGTNGNMIIDASNQNNNATTTSKVLLSNLTVLSKQQATSHGQIIGNNQQQPQSASQTINFVNAKNLYTNSTAGTNIAGAGKQKFTVAAANIGNYKSSPVKQTSPANTPYLQSSNALGPQKINMTAGNRNMQMLTARVQNAANSNVPSNVSNNNSISLISNNSGSAQTMVLQQQQKYISNNATGSKISSTPLSSSVGNVIKKSATSGTVRMSNSHNNNSTKLMNNVQSTQGVKTFITQSSNGQQQTQHNINQLTLQHHTTKGSSKSKFVKQYNNAIINSAGTVAIATLPHQQSNTQQHNLQIQQLQPQATYINHQRGVSGSTKINKINSKYAQSVNMAGHLPAGTQLHQKSINQSQQPQQQFQTTNCNSNIKFVNAQGTVIQQQQPSLAPQKINNKQQQNQQQYQNLQNFDTVDGNQVFNQANVSQSPADLTSSMSTGTTPLPLATAAGSSLLTDDIMMVNGTQMTDELSARILQSMSQKSFSNQRYQQQQVFQTKTSTSPTIASSSSNVINNTISVSKNNFSSNNNMLPPPRCTTQNTIAQTNNSILLSPREYTLYPTASTASNVNVVSGNQPIQQQQHLSPIHYNNLATTTASISSNMGPIPFSSNNYITVSNNSTSMTTITAHTSGISAGNSLLCSNTSVSTTNSLRQSQSAPGSRSQSMERKLHESSMSRKTTEYYKAKIKDYRTGCTFVVPSTATIYATNTSPTSTSLIDFIIPLPPCTSITTTNNITTSTNCSTMTTIITNSSFNHNLNQINNNNNSNHNSSRGSSHHNNLTTATSTITQTSGSLGMATNNLSSSASNVMGSGIPTPTLPSPSTMSRPSGLLPAALIMEPQAQVIHLQATKTLPGANNSSNDDDDDIIGEEVRPVPVDTEDIRLRILHAVLLDHTYVNPIPLELPTSFSINLSSASKSHTITTPSSVTASTAHCQQWSLGGIGAIPTAASGGVAQQNYNSYETQLSNLRQESDSYLAISNSSLLATGDIDPGEETETAAEAELEDDSVTRCICDLTHDDGYMICCDKCCAWQHVDCMGIDRQNIPDEYLCELCQPRVVDKARARSLQLMKRKEQQQQLMLTAQAQVSSSAGTIGATSSPSIVNLGATGNVHNDVLGAQHRTPSSNSAAFNLVGNVSDDSPGNQLLGASNLKKSKMLKKVKDGVSAKRSKKGEKLAAATAVSCLITSSKPVRKETKKNTKRKKSGAHENSSSTLGMTAVEKHAANLRQWIENYEFAVTNHYSPELRARLHAISKQPSLLQCILNTENPILKEFSNGSLENRATTVPHAGGKILISNLDIVPNSPICELRGKYMLTTQYKTQNTSMNMNSPPPNNYHLGSYKAHKTPGPFIFFYQLPGTEVGTSYPQSSQTTTTTTINSDGTYTTTTTTLPAQQSPPTFLKGPEICVDTRTYGNEARFVRRSCRPNAEIQHLFEKGTIHLFIVALTDIRASTEITIRHEPHDLLAVDNKKSISVVIQPTSTLCACGLTKDCIFGPPIPQLSPAGKSSAGRKSLGHGGGISGNGGNLTSKQRKVNQQNSNRNRSISSSASGDSNMGITANTVAISLNSPNNITKMTVTNKTTNSNIPIPLSTSCNSNMSNASSTSSNLASVMNDSGVCTSSSSPSVSIPSPTQHMHSPIQQVSHQFVHNSQMRSAVQMLPQHQHQQLMQTLPTPLVLTTANLPHQPQQKQHPIVQKPTVVALQQQQPLTVIAQTTTVLNSAEDVNETTERKQLQASNCLPTQEVIAQPSHIESQTRSINHQQGQQKHAESQSTQHSDPEATASAGLLETVSPEATIAAVALQSLNGSHSENVSLPATSIECSPLEIKLQPTQIQQQQFIVVENSEVQGEQLQQPIQEQSQILESTKVIPSATSPISSPHQPSQQEIPQPLPVQHHKSPQKNNHSQNGAAHVGRKTAGKNTRTTSYSEDNELHNEDNAGTPTPTFSSTPKEKPKLSREDRKMEAILRAIEKMERNQQKQKQTKRQNSSSQNTTPTSPNKALESTENSGGVKRGTNHLGSGGRSKKKRKSGAKGGQGGVYNQRKRRQSRMNSGESVEESNHQDQDAITSESDSCAPMHSPTVQTMASLSKPNFSTPTSPSVIGRITSTINLPADTTSNVNQAAGLLLAFANPNISSINSASLEKVEQNVPQSPHRTASQYIMDSTTSPPTPPSQVSSACLLIEAAVGPLESNLDSNSTEIHNAEFKYPLQAKTKKLLMNNWLHQAEDNASDNRPTVSEQTSETLQVSVANSVDCSGIAGASAVSGGLDSLLEAAMSDLKQSQTNPEQPQNLSIAAQKVEEFIQQTEASSCGTQIQPQIKHSYEYGQHQQSQKTYMQHLPIPTVDLTLKTPLTIGSNLSSESTSNNRNFSLPLQVSTCSNNSSVKKRWLRQAISEETHEEFQNTFAITSSTTNAVVLNTFSSSQVPQHPICSPVSIASFVPNGFTTPLKKRRLLLTGKDEIEETTSQGCVDLCGNSTLTPPPIMTTQQQQIQFDTLQRNVAITPEVENKETGQDTHDVDEGKSEICETTLNPAQDSVLECQTQRDQQYLKVELDQVQDVDVTTSPVGDSTPLQGDSAKIVIKYENDMTTAEVKQESLETSIPYIEPTAPTEFNDQEDDVDILRSPSPGREMIKAEDNLVKIEPEDISGMNDVKIDVEREESMAADDDVVTQHKENNKEPKTDVFNEYEQNDIQPLLSNLKVNKHLEMEMAKENQVEKEIILKSDIKVEKSTTEIRNDLEIKTENESREPKSKRIRMEKHEVDHLVCIKKEFTIEKIHATDEKSLKTDFCAKAKVSHKLEFLSNSTTKEDEKCLEAESIGKIKQSVCTAIIEEASGTKSTAADTTFDDMEASPSSTTAATIIATNSAPMKRQKSLSDDDIQARLHSFHKENILILQSRNKKTKSGANINTPPTNCLTNNDNQKTKAASASSFNHQHHHSHHNHYNIQESKEKLDKSNLKHYKHSSSTTSGSTKKQKLHKRERTTSSSSSNSNKNITNSQITPFSSELNKNSVTISNSALSKSSKKVKSLKKSSLGSSASSLSSYSLSTLTLQNTNSMISTSTTNINSEKERSIEKEKHYRQRTTSSSNNNISGSNSNQTPIGSFPSTKKRQLNFELELTKDRHLVNNAPTGGNKHKREISKQLSDEQSIVPTKKSRKELNLLQKEEFKNGTNKHVKIEKPNDKKMLVSTGKYSSSSEHADTSISTTSTNVIHTYTTMEEHIHIPIVVSRSPQQTLTPTPILREHPTIPHFNNLVIGASSSLANLQPSVLSAQQNATVVPQILPNHTTSPSYISPTPSNYNQQLQLPPLPPTPPPVACLSSPLSAQNVNSTSHLPFYNTIYGKLLDNPTPSTLSTPLTPSPPLSATSAQTTGGGVLSEYLDTKLKSYNTLGGYVSHTALFGLNNAPVIRDPSVSPAVVSSTTISIGSTTAHTTDASVEMPAPAAVCNSSTTISCSSNTSTNAITSLKILTKTASHDPRLNPQLTAPEPPPQPKRKLSINEYRKRMQQSSSNDSTSGSGILNMTHTPPPTMSESPSNKSIMCTMTQSPNKYKLNSPDHLAQSVDSQIQKEILSTTSVLTSSSPLDSLNSSNSSTSSNDTLLKTSSFVEEDSTKGQFNAAPTLLEKQQESLCARLKSLKEKQSLGSSFTIGSGNRSRFTSFSESVTSGEFGFRKEVEEMDIIRNRNISVSSSIGGGDLLDNCLEEISSTSTSMSSSREPSPARCYTSCHNFLTASATTTVTNTSTTSHNKNGQTTRHHHQQQSLNCEKPELINLDLKKSVDTV